jgi:uncharacterized protein YbdZ (MbtH family)
MSWHDTDSKDTTIYKVVVNHEEQYSIWHIDRENAPGWNDIGKSGTKQECLTYVEQVWTDMRPLNLRRQREQEIFLPEPRADGGESDDTASRIVIVEHLSEGDHPLSLSLRPEKSIVALREALERAYINVVFTGTGGETELGVRLDRESLDSAHANLETQTGTLHLEGELILDSIRVRCLADIDLSSLEGRGRLQPLTT